MSRCEADFEEHVLNVCPDKTTLSTHTQARQPSSADFLAVLRCLSAHGVGSSVPGGGQSVKLA